MPKATWDDIEGSPWEEELEDFPIYDGEQPPKGVYRVAMKLLRLKRNKNGDPMLNGLLVINEPKGSKKAQYNGYDFWFNLNVTSQGSRWVNNFLSALAPENKVAAIRKAFWEKKVMIDKGEPPAVLSIGGVKIVENMLLTAVCKMKQEYGGTGTTLDVAQFSRPTDMKLNTEGFDSGPESANEEDWEDESEADVEEAEEETEEPEGDEEFEARVEELEAMNRNALLKAAKAVGVTVKRGTPEDEIVDAILAEEFPPEEDDEDETEEEPEDEEPEEDEEVAEEPEEEPEPPKKAARRRPAAKPAAAKEEPAAPTRARTGTRRRAGGKPPF